MKTPTLGPTQLCLMMALTTSLPSVLNRPPTSKPQTRDRCTRAPIGEGQPLGWTRTRWTSTICSRSTASVLTQLPGRSISNTQCAGGTALLHHVQHHRCPTDFDEPSFYAQSHFQVAPANVRFRSWPWQEAFTSVSKCTPEQECLLPPLIA